ncbi:MAG: GTPase HflX [Deltaproteobacteria bacterium]|nr:GTPase HflX [Deltaproteobacteria bacterium]
MNFVSGSTLGLKHSQIAKLEKFAIRRVPANRLITPELARNLTELSFEINRQLGLLIDRKGRIQQVIVGDARSIFIPRLAGWRVGAGRLRGLRLVHTHLKNERLSQEDLTDLALLRLDLIASIGVDDIGLPTTIEIAHLLPPNPKGLAWRAIEPTILSHLDLDFLGFIKSLEDEIYRTVSSRGIDSQKEMAYLVGKTSGTSWEVEESIEELSELASSCGLRVVGFSVQRRDSVDPHYVVGKGKLKEIVIDALHKGADVLVFDTELSAPQVKAISEFTEIKVLDRSQLILDIFAQRAKSSEGKLQVELAQLKYALPKLSEKDDALSRLTGGIGGRGPGETRLEIDRRRIRSRIDLLEKRIAQVAKSRSLRRSLRTRKHIPVISIVGYTNAGKSTLLNNLTKSRVLVENKLFATLDPTSRRLRFPRDTEVIITDTVGFIKDLPETLVKAFAATLDELADADLLLHVIDSSNPNVEKQIEAVENLLDKLLLSKKPILRVFNKIDIADHEMVDNLCVRYNGIALSALRSETFSTLIERMEDEILKRIQVGQNSHNDGDVAEVSLSNNEH